MVDPRAEDLDEVGGPPTWEFNGLRQENTAVSAIAAISVFDRSNIALGGPDVSSTAIDTGRARVAIVSGNYFSMLGIGAARGRTLTADDDRAPGQHRVAVISDDY